ncbi:4110_t:CDS:2, partial [Scutellospora calospora]
SKTGLDWTVPLELSPVPVQFTMSIKEEVIVEYQRLYNSQKENIQQTQKVKEYAPQSFLFKVHI